MAIPFDRKIISQTWVLPEIVYTDILEEGGTPKVYGTVDPIVGKHLGAKSRGGQVQIAHDQLTDTWTSFQSTRTGNNWEDADDFAMWEDSSFILGPWEARVDYDLAPDAYPLTIRDMPSTEPPAAEIIFLYVKNNGPSTVELTLDGTNYYIPLVNGASFQCRLDNVSQDNILIRQQDINDPYSVIEYLAAI